MYTSHIGRRLLTLYRERTGEELSARQFFEQRLYPLFYNSAKYLQWIPSSPFAQDLNKDEKALVALGHSPYEIKLGKLHEKINGNLGPDASFVIGFPAAGVEGTTSGQVSGVGPQVGADDIYCSWIGGALGVGVSGKLTLLLDEDEVLWTLYEGWRKYRTFLKQHPTLKGNQIDTWNGVWLTHSFHEYFDSNDPFAGFSPTLSEKNGVLSIDKVDWVQILFQFARNLKKDKLLAYVFDMDKTNRTLGFIPIKLPDFVRLESEVNQHLFLFPSVLESGGEQDLLNLYRTEYGIARAAQNGSIGLTEIQPEGLWEFFARKPGNKKRTQIQLAFYETWIIAMLNKRELDAAATSLAGALLNFARSESRDKQRSQAVKALWTTTSQQKFIAALNQLICKGMTDIAALTEAVNQTMDIPFDQFPLFITLTQFRYLTKSQEAETTIEGI